MDSLILSSEEPVTLVNLDGQIAGFCKTSDFKRYVRDAINDEMFWRNILQTYSISSMVQTELTNSVPIRVQNEANKIINKMVDERLDNYTKFQIPSHVSKALSEQIAVFLNNNAHMNQILETHSASQNMQLYSSAMETLHKVVNEPQYHMVTNAHIDAMKTKYDESLLTINKNAEQQVLSNESKFNLQIESFKHQVNSETALLTETRVKLSQAETRIAELSNDIGIIKVILGAFVGFCAVGFGAMGYVMKK